jgi:hypothetical protein
MAMVQLHWLEANGIEVFFSALYTNQVFFSALCTNQGHCEAQGKDRWRKQYSKDQTHNM